MIESKWVYLAGPMTAEPYKGVSMAVQAAERLRKKGFVPVVPQLTSLWAMIGSDACYEDWMRLDFEYIRRCDTLLRLPGDSVGADREVAFAQSLSKPVFFRESDLIAAFPPEPYRCVCAVCLVVGDLRAKHE